MSTRAHPQARRDMDRLSRRIVALMIVAGAILTVLSLTMNMDRDRLRAQIGNLVSGTASFFGGVEVQPR